MATSLPFSVPTNSNSCSTVSTAVFLRRGQIHLSKARTRQYKSTKLRSFMCRLLPVTNVDRHQVVKVQTTPLLHFCRTGGAEESPAHLWTGTSQKHCGELLPEARLTALKQLIGLIHNQPLHTDRPQSNKRQQKPTVSFFLWFFCQFTVKEETRSRHQDSTTTDSVLPAKVESWRILFEEEDESVRSTDEYICREM